MPTLSLVAMSDELPPPPVSNTRASQIAVNFAARVKHQMKDERKQVARIRTARRSLTTRPAGTHTPAHSHWRAAVDRAREGARIGGSAQGGEAYAQVQLLFLLLAPHPPLLRARR